MKDEEEEIKSKVVELTDYVVDSLSPAMFAMAFLPCIIWLFMLFVAYTVLFKIPASIIKNIYNKLVDMFKR